MGWLGICPSRAMLSNCRYLMLNYTYRLLYITVLASMVACSSAENSAQEFVEKGKKLLAEGEAVKAGLEFRNALQLNPNLVPALFGYAQAEELLGNWETVFRQLKKVVDLDPKHQQALVKLGKLMLAADQLDQALALGKTAVELDPGNPDALALQAATLYKLDDQQGAVQNAKLALERAPNHPEASMVLAIERLEAGEARETIELLDRSTENTGDRVVVQLIRIKALIQLEQFDSAEEVYQRLIERYPDERGLKHALAQFYLQQNRSQDAERLYRSVSESNPADVDAKLELLRFIYRTKGSDAAEQELASMIAADPASPRLKFSLAQFYLSKGETAKAESVYKEAADQFGNTDSGLTAKVRLAALMLDRNEVEHGLELIDQVLTLDKRHGEALILKATRHIAVGETDTAIAELRTALRDAPDSSRALLLLGRAHELAGSVELAEDQYTRAYQLDPTSVATGMAYARFLLRRKNLERADAVLQQVVSRAPDQIGALQMLTEIRLVRGEWRGAEEIAKKLKETDAKNAIASQLVGAAYAGQGKFSDSITAFQDAHRSAPMAVQPIVALVRVFLAAGKKEDAYLFLNNVLEANPSNEAALVLKSQLYISDSKFDQAEQTLQMVTRLHPQYLPAYRNLSKFYLRVGRPNAALQTVRQGLEVHPDDYSLRLVLAGLQESFGEYEASIASYEALYTETPHSDLVVNNLANLLIDYRNDSASHKQALQLSQRFRQANMPYYKDTLGWAQYRNGDIEAAKRTLLEVVEQSPTVAVFRYHLGMVYQDATDTEKARQELEEAMRLSETSPFPQLEEARKALNQLGDGVAKTKVEPRVSVPPSETGQPTSQNTTAQPSSSDPLAPRGEGVNRLGD